MKANLINLIIFLCIFQSIFSNKNIRHLDISYDKYNITFNNTNWSYDSTNGVYYQIGVVYCKYPATIDYNSLGIYVPANYLSCSYSFLDKYTCTVNSSGTVGNYKASTAHIVMKLTLLVILLKKDQLHIHIPD